MAHIGRGSRMLAQALHRRVVGRGPVTPPDGLWGRVVSVQQGSNIDTCTLQIGGTTSQVPGVEHLDSYNPQPGAQVYYHQIRGVPFIIGAMGPFPPPLDLASIPALIFAGYNAGVAAAATSSGTFTGFFVAVDVYSAFNHSTGIYTCPGQLANSNVALSAQGYIYSTDVVNAEFDINGPGSSTPTLVSGVTGGGGGHLASFGVTAETLDQGASPGDQFFLELQNFDTNPLVSISGHASLRIVSYPAL